MEKKKEEDGDGMNRKSTFVLPKELAELQVICLR